MTNPRIKKMNITCKSCHNSLDESVFGWYKDGNCNGCNTFNTRECINGHKFTGMNIGNWCPQCGSKWKEGGGEWEKLLSHKFDFMIEQGIKDKLWTEFERKAFKFVEKSIKEDIEEALASSRSQVVEEIRKELKHIAMVDNGKEPKYFVKDVLNILDRLK